MTGHGNQRDRRSRKRSGTYVLLALSLLAIGAIFGAGSSGAGAAPACSQETFTSEGGTVVELAPCATEVEVTSPTVTTIIGNESANVIYAGPNVEAIYGEGGNDVIYAGPNTALVEGGTGEDIIYGEPTDKEVSPEAEGEAPTYEFEGGEANGGVEYEPQGSESETGRSAGTHAAFSPLIAAANEQDCENESPCLGGTGDQILRGGPGPDLIFGERGDDEILGEGGDDALYGGDGDDKIHGGTGDDFIAGGPGTDEIFGEEDNDLVRGDGTIDKMSGGGGENTLSFTTAVTPGFTGPYPAGIAAVTGFPEETSGEHRGVYVRLDEGSTSCGFPACDNAAGLGGGADEIEVSEFQNVIGSPFADVIVGSSGANKIWGGGGGDVIIGGGGADHLYGGADGDYIQGSSEATADGGAGSDNCEGVGSITGPCGTKAEVIQHEESTMEAGEIFTTNPANSRDGVYLIGSKEGDEVNATYSGGTVVFHSTGATRFAGESEGCEYTESGAVATCPLPTGVSGVDALVMAGLGGPDNLSILGGGFPLATSPQILGGPADDALTGSNTTEDVLVDGPGGGEDHEKGYGYDDWLLNNEGKDLLEGGDGNDLFLSTTTCDGDTLNGAAAGEEGDGEDQNNASWAKLTPGRVTASLEENLSGDEWNESAQTPTCPGEADDHLYGMDDLEGSNQADILFGNGGHNSILGHAGDDWLNGLGGNDTMLAKDGEKDNVVGGAGEDDVCKIDWDFDSRTGCEELLPPPIPTETFATPGKPVGGEVGSITVKGHVKPARNTVKGRKVNVNFQVKKSGVWTTAKTAQETLVGQAYEAKEVPLAPGNYRTRTVFLEQGQFEKSESNYHGFTITPSKYPTKTHVTMDTVENGQPGKFSLHGSVGTPEGGGPLPAGDFVNVNLFKWVGEAWEPTSTIHVVLSEGTYEVKEHALGVGKWRLRAAFPEQLPFGFSASEYHVFTIEGTEYKTETFLSIDSVTPGSPGRVSLSGHVNVTSGEGGSVEGKKVNIEFEKKEGSSWVPKSSVKATIGKGGEYSVANREVGVGTWRAQATFEVSGAYKESQSIPHEFTVTKS